MIYKELKSKDFKDLIFQASMQLKLLLNQIVENL